MHTSQRTTTPCFSKVICDSINRVGVRLTTLQVKLPRIVLAEFNTHRMFSRNASSSRAIPISRMIEAIREQPMVPFEWGKNQAGMQAAESAFSKWELLELEDDWLELMDIVSGYVERVFVKKWNLPKQIANRPLEPWMWSNVVVTATDWQNFFNLRITEAAQPEIRDVATSMRDSLRESTPTPLMAGEWHLPYVMDSERGLHVDELKKMSVARCARVSYKTHDNKNTSAEEDIKLHDRLLEMGHMSPFEHPAMAAKGYQYVGNFRGFIQYRKDIPCEAVYIAGYDRG